jgi:hypothetical protein
MLFTAGYPHGLSGLSVFTWRESSVDWQTFLLGFSSLLSGHNLQHCGHIYKRPTIKRVLGPCRSESDFSRPQHSTARARLDMCELTSAVFRRPVGELPRFGFFRLLGGNSRRLLTRMLLPFGTCLIVLTTMEAADYTEYELALKQNPLFLLLLCYVSIVQSSFYCLLGNNSSKVFKFRKPNPKIFEKNYFQLSFRRPNRVWDSPSSSSAQNTLWIQYIRFTGFPSSERS